MFVLAQMGTHCKLFNTEEKFSFFQNILLANMLMKASFLGEGQVIQSVFIPDEKTTMDHFSG